MASTDGAEAEFGDPHRKKLLEALKDALGMDTVRPTAWACLWLSDIEKLEELVAETQAKAPPTRLLLEGVEAFARIVPRWTQRQRLSSTASSPQNPSISPLQPPSVQDSRGQKRNSSGQPVISRSKSQGNQCRQRDRKKCILINAGEPIEVAHIYPYSLRYEDNTRPEALSFWDVLRTFWSEKRIDTWYSAIFSSPAKTEVCQNLLCLSPHAHAYWERAYFALKPISISDDKKRLDIQFFWLLSNPHVPGINILQAPSISTISHGPNLARLFNHETTAQISSGDEFSLTTDDPVSKPLPDFRLLEMQWFLHRVTAMSGAAEPQDDFHDEDSNDDFMLALQDRLDMYMEDQWDMGIEKVPTTEHFEEGRSLARPFGVDTVQHMVRLRGGYLKEDHEGEDHEGEDHEGENHEGEDHEGEDHEGEDHEGEDHEGEDHEEEDHEGEDYEGQGREGEEQGS